MAAGRVTWAGVILHPRLYFACRVLLWGLGLMPRPYRAVMAVFVSAGFRAVELEMKSSGPPTDPSA